MFWNKKKPKSKPQIKTCMLLHVPKVDLDGDGYEVEVEDGFVTKGVGWRA